MRALCWDELEKARGLAVEAVGARPGLSILILAEPTPTLTRGRSAESSDLLAAPEALAARGIAIRDVGRGGKWTYHGPGQLLVYPIVRLRDLGYGSRGVKRFLTDFRRVLQGAIASLGMESVTGDSPFGLFSRDAGKLVSFGLAVSRGITSHGAAIYLEPQRVGFSAVNPCGVAGQRVASLRELGVRAGWEEAAQTVEMAMKKHFAIPRDPLL